MFPAASGGDPDDIAADPSGAGSAGAGPGPVAVLVEDPVEAAALEERAARAQCPDEDDLRAAGVDVPDPWVQEGFAGWLEALAAADPLRPRDPAVIVATAETAPLTPSLLAELATVDAATLDPSAQVGYVVAWARVENLAVAGKLTGIAALAGPAPTGPAPTGPAPVGPASVRPASADLATLTDHAFAFAEVGAALRVGDGESTALVHAARELTVRLPATLAAMRAGTLSWRKARTLVERTATLTDDQCAQIETTVLPHAGTRTPAQHDAALRRAIDRLDPTAAAQRRRHREHDITLIRCHVGDGMAELFARLPSEDAELLWAGADAWARRGKSTGDPRPLEHLRVAALVTAMESFLTHGTFTPTGTPTGTPTSTPTGSATGAPATGTPTSTPTGSSDGDGTGSSDGTDRPRPGDRAASSDPGRAGAGAPRRHGRPITINLTLDLPTFLGLTDHPGELLGTGTLIPAAAIRDLLPDAQIRRLITHPLSGHLLDATPHTVRPSAPLAAFVALRDVTATTPTAGPTGSATGAGAGDLDHLIARRDGGPTTRANLHSPTRRWHRAKTLAGWTVHHNDHGGWTWTSPTGRTYDTAPHDYRLSDTDP
ncbi:MAG TPA: DUF222 domain-containing protein [Mycobacteriales bacterium]|nr:DUF222 domain-containing protein [Mycobacteriales bacterium]